MEKTSIEFSLLEPEEKEMLEYIWNHIQEDDRRNMSQDDILFVLDSMDDYLESVGLLKIDEKTGEMEYLDGDVDETAQLEYVVDAVKNDHRDINKVQIQLIMDGELQYGIENGYYEEED